MSNHHIDCTESEKRLFEAVSKLETPEECRAFFEDLCTVKEIKEMAQRLDTAFLLDSGCSYQQIADKSGISSATISRVNRALINGSDGYRNAIDKMNSKEKTK